MLHTSLTDVFAIIVHIFLIGVKPWRFATG